MEEFTYLKCRQCGGINRIPPDKLAVNPRCGKCRAALDLPSSPLDVTSSSFDREVRSWPGRVLVEFEDKRCVYCRQIAGAVNDLAKKLAGRVKIVRVDIQAEQSLAQRFAIQATPTFILFQNGAQRARREGVAEEIQELERWAGQT